ncbi:MAG: hypothetical protein QS98_C0005G0055 [archaeon GW2011_AR3]|nr:MAG: hypothetical protein QS98_C0005G0055 [archaeon GW2011_AR3]MBS3109440.1 amidohydrolase family protein [Candidatus Woesearchaeota archaeon]
MLKLKMPFLKTEAPRDFEVWDCHTHIGTDRDGLSLEAEKLLQLMKISKLQKCVAFPFDEVAAGEDFHAPNDRIYKAFMKYPDRIIPFFRINPNFPAWKNEAVLRKSQGFKGIKLHPRAQKFKILDPKAKEVFGWASENKIPILMHTGLGMGKIGLDVRKLLSEFGSLRLIFGHAGIADLDNVIDAVRSVDNRHVYFETSVVKAYDLIDLIDRVEADRIIFGSDVPYGDMEAGVQLLKDIAEAADIDSDALANIFKNNLQRCLDGR